METDLIINNEMHDNIITLTNLIISNLHIDEFDLDQIKKRMFRLAYGRANTIEKDRSDVFKIMYEKFEDLKENKNKIVYRKPIPEPESDSSDSSDSSDDDSDNETIFDNIKKPIEPKSEEEMIEKYKQRLFK